MMCPKVVSSDKQIMQLILCLQILVGGTLSDVLDVVLHI